jgi:hypothetical protein
MLSLPLLSLPDIFTYYRRYAYQMPPFSLRFSPHCLPSCASFHAIYFRSRHCRRRQLTMILRGITVPTLPPFLRHMKPLLLIAFTLSPPFTPLFTMPPPAALFFEVSIL